MKPLAIREKEKEKLAVYEGTHLTHTGRFMYYESTDETNAFNLLALSAATSDHHANSALTNMVALLAHVHCPEGANRVDFLNNHVMAFADGKNSFERVRTDNAIACLIPLDPAQAIEEHMDRFTGFLAHMEKIQPMLMMLAVATVMKPTPPEAITKTDPRHPFARLIKAWPSDHPVKIVYAGEAEHIHVHFVENGKVLCGIRPYDEICYEIGKPGVTGIIRCGLVEPEEFLRFMRAM